MATNYYRFDGAVNALDDPDYILVGDPENPTRLNRGEAVQLTKADVESLEGRYVFSQVRKTEAEDEQQARVVKGDDTKGGGLAGPSAVAGSGEGPDRAESR